MRSASGGSRGDASLPCCALWHSFVDAAKRASGRCDVFGRPRDGAVEHTHERLLLFLNLAGRQPDQRGPVDLREGVAGPVRRADDHRVVGEQPFPMQNGRRCPRDEALDASTLQLQHPRLDVLHPVPEAVLPFDDNANGHSAHSGRDERISKHRPRASKVDRVGDDVDEVDNSASAEDNHILLVLPRGARFARAACVRVAAERWRRTVRTRARLPEQRHAPNQGLQMVCASNTRTSLAAEI